MWNIPNILTVVRLAFAVALPLVFIFIQRPYADWTALILFIAVALTDFLDGYLARLWKQTSKLGAMLDPIADKAMVVIALLALVGLTGMHPLIMVPATLITFREIFVSGLREFLGADAGKLAVTKLAKWKTATQMVAISALLAAGIFEHHLGMRTFGMDHELVDAILFEGADDPLHLKALLYGFQAAWYGGLVLLSMAAALTVLTGWDYLRKAMPYLQE